LRAEHAMRLHSAAWRRNSSDVFTAVSPRIKFQVASQFQHSLNKRHAAAQQ
jgi:hypothetical protein